MTNTPGPSARQPYTTAYGWYPAPPGAKSQRPDQRSRALWAAVAVLGAATFGVSVAAPVASGYPMRLSVFAAVVAAVGLLPGQGDRGWIVVALAATGFGDATCSWVVGGIPNWAVTVVMVLTALQSLAAAGALLHEGRATHTKDAATGDYSAYAQLTQLYQAYAAHYQQPRPESQAAAYATAAAQAEAAARGADAAQESFADLQARYARHGVGATEQPARGSSGVQSVAPAAAPGVPGANHVASEPGSYHARRQAVDQSAIEPTGP